MHIHRNDSKHSLSVSMNDTADLCVLGILFNDARTLQGLFKAVSLLDTAHWSPTRDVLEVSVRRLLDQGHLVSLESSNQTYYSITGKGIKRFFSLMKLPVGAYSLNTQSMLALKSSFLEDVPAVVRAQTVRELMSYYACKLNCLEKDCENCAFYSGRQKMTHDLQIHQIKTELNWLHGLTTNLAAC